MKVLWLPVCAFLAVVLCGCKIAEFEHGAGYEQKFGHPVGESPYMPTIHNEDELRRNKLKNWQEIYTQDQGHVGYLLAEEVDYYKPAQHRIIYYVYDLNTECIGFFTENGETFRFHFDDYRQQKEMIGHYEPEESCMHLLKCKTPCEFKPLSVKPAQD
jgi:hypothetical protein